MEHEQSGTSHNDSPSRVWTVVFGLAILLFGVGTIAVASLAEFPKDSKWKVFLEHLGIAITVGGFVHLVFVVALVRHLLADIERLSAKNSKLLGETVTSEIEKGNTRLGRFNSLGIEAAYRRLSISQFRSTLIQGEPTSGDGIVRVLETFAFSPGDWIELLRDAVDHGREVRILLGDETCASVILRIIELNMAPNGEGSVHIRASLATVMAGIRANSSLRAAYESKRIQLHTYLCAPAAAIWGVGNDLLVSWYLQQKASIFVPHIHCKAATRLIPAHQRGKRAGMSLGDDVLVHFNKVWETSKPVALDYGTNVDQTIVPTVKALHILRDGTVAPATESSALNAPESSEPPPT
jgi:hypothetical protein